jgi:hypothetical protein
MFKKAVVWFIVGGAQIFYGLHGQFTVYLYTGCAIAGVAFCIMAYEAFFKTGDAQ